MTNWCPLTLIMNSCNECGFHFQRIIWVLPNVCVVTNAVEILLLQLIEMQKLLPACKLRCFWESFGILFQVYGNIYLLVYWSIVNIFCSIQVLSLPSKLPTHLDNLGSLYLDFCDYHLYFTIQATEKYSNSNVLLPSATKIQINANPPKIVIFRI